MRKSLTDRQIKLLRPDPSKRLTVSDPEMAGHYVRVTPAGAKSFVAIARNPSGKQVWITLGSCDHIGIEESRMRAKVAVDRVKRGLPPFEAPGKSFDEVAADWLKRHVDAKELRSAKEVRRVLARYISPVLGTLPFEGIRRADVVALLDHVEDEHGGRQADVALAIVRSIMNWHATRSDGYAVPLVRGMGRGQRTKRDRILSDEELRALWPVAPGFLKICLLTAQRRAVVAGMRWEDIEAGVWTIPLQRRAKGTAGKIPLPKLALAIIEEQPRIPGEPVFRTFGSKHKAQIEVVDAWTIHDLRRTARSLMSRAGVRREIAERVLGHAIDGVEGVYDRHDYTLEKGKALAALAGLVERILEPDINIIALRG